LGKAHGGVDSFIFFGNIRQNNISLGTHATIQTEKDYQFLSDITLQK
jgi:hypothetical protein